MSPLDRVQLIENKQFFVSCIVPVFNEEANVGNFLPQLASYLQNLTNFFEIIVVDDGSSDTTAMRVIELQASNRNLKFLKFSRNFGKEVALSAGLEHAKGDLAILMDADFQHPIEVIKDLLARWQEGYDMVYAVRDNRDNESLIKRNSAHLFYWIMSKITHIEIPNNAGDFRLLDRKIINTINNFGERTRFMKGLYAWVGFKKIAVPYEVESRSAGQSTWGFRKLTELAITGITSFSDIPLRVWGFVGFIISLLSFIYAVYIAITTLIYGTDLPGFPTLVVAIMFFGGIQLLSIGILGEYIARIFTEVKQRPNYIVESKHGFE